MTIRFLGLSDEQRLAIEETTGVKTEGAQLIVEAAVQQANEMMQKAIREVQEVVGPHGSVTRLQAGGVRISSGLGVSVYENGVLKTTIEPDGDFLAGSDITQPANTTFAVFVNEQTYNNEAMGAGDLLIGNNTSTESNVKYDASEGQLQFRLGTTVNVYMDTDGSLKAGAGAVTLDNDGVLIEIPASLSDQNAYKFLYQGVVKAGMYAFKPSPNRTDLWLQANDVTAVVNVVADGGTTAGQIKLHAFGDSYGALLELIGNSSQGIIIANSGLANQDFQISGDTDANLVYVDASTDRVGIGDSTPSYKLDVNGDVSIASGNSYRINGVPIPVILLFATYTDVSPHTATGRFPHLAGVSRDLTLVNWIQPCRVLTTSDSSNYWTITLSKADGTVIASVTTATVNTTDWKNIAASFSPASIVASSSPILYTAIATKTGSPGNLYLGAPICEVIYTS